MKNKCFLFVMLLLPVFCLSERLYSRMEKDVAVVGYTVLEGESLLDISEKFNLNIARLSLVNKISQDSPLKAGDELIIPVSKVLSGTCPKENCVTLYYKAQKGEGLYRISKNFGYQNTRMLKALNDLTNESIVLGQLLVVGYLDNALFATAKKQMPVTIQGTIASTAKTEDHAPAFTSIQPEKVPDITDSLSEINMRYKGEGVFKSEYIPGNHQSSMHAGIFKTETGWRDGKFYLLMDKMEVGSVVKLQNKTTGAVIYAKVLSELPQVRKKDRVQLRISNAAAATLGVGEAESFELMLSY